MLPSVDMQTLLYWPHLLLGFSQDGNACCGGWIWVDAGLGRRVAGLFLEVKSCHAVPISKQAAATVRTAGLISGASP